MLCNSIYRDQRCRSFSLLIELRQLVASRCSSCFACSQPGPGLLPLSSFLSICSGRLLGWLNRSGCFPVKPCRNRTAAPKAAPAMPALPPVSGFGGCVAVCSTFLDSYVPVLIRHPFKHLNILILAKAEPWTASASSYIRFAPQLRACVKLQV